MDEGILLETLSDVIPVTTMIPKDSRIGLFYYILTRSFFSQFERSKLQSSINEYNLIEV